MSDGFGLSDDFVRVSACVCVLVVLPKELADAAPVAESLACRSYTGRYRWP